ncbi:MULTISPECIES: T9SS type A sorting domain-containing protein [unclassified Imperialibacter]|uniref:T9SS type A sorting domain-containing protein n=1 Tax=unclassified Imperialibacter TaxID=2629706 RepID=UPI00186A515F|nr:MULTISPECIES: T9SS type A sorting domain-containing protein [unclassified Imperialibacter]
MTHSFTSISLQVGFQGILLTALLLFVVSLEGISQPELTRIETPNSGTGDGPYFYSLADLNGKAYYPHNSTIIEVDEGLNRTEITPVSGDGYSNTINYIAPLGDKLFIDRFYFYSYAGEPALVDPADGSVTFIKDINPSGYAYTYDVFSAGDKVYFRSYDGNGYDIWVTDGTESGTFKIISGSYSSIKYFSNGNLTFISLNNNQVWATDGTLDGTKKISNDGVYTYYMTGASTENYFYYTIRGSNNLYQIFKSDGTPEGTNMIAQSESFNISYVFDIDGEVYYSTYSDGTINFNRYREAQNQSVTVASHPYAISFFASNGSDAYFIDSVSPYRIWKLDVSSGSAEMIVTFANNQYYQGSLNGFAGDKLVFAIYSPDTGNELWVTDGTESGTGLLKDIYPGPFSSLYNTNRLFESNVLGKIFFRARNPETGQEVWVSDGTSSGTSLLEDTNTALQSISMFKMIATEDKLYAQTSYYGNGVPNLYQLSPGEAQLTSPLEGEEVTFETQGGIADLNNDIYFYGSQLNNDGSFQQGLTKLAGDGTISQVKDDIYLYTYGLTKVNGKLFFAGYGEGYELWVSEDGTSDGTYQVANIAPGYGSSVETNSSKDLPITFFKNKYFFAANDNTSGRELWITDLTEEGTTLFFDLEPGSDGSYPENFFVAGDRLYFTAETNGSTQLWVTDGTPQNTRVIETVNAVSFFHVGNEVYFLEDYDYRYYALWKTDGTADGTEEILDLGYSYYSIPAIQSDRGLLYVDYNNSTGYYDYYFIDNEGLQTTLKTGGAQAYGFFAKGNYIYYNYGFSFFYMTNGSDIDEEVINLYDEAFLTPYADVKNFTAFGDDLVFNSYDYSDYVISLWKLSLFKPVATVIYDSDPLESEETINFGTLSEGNQSGIETVTIENGGFVDWSFPQGSTLAVMGDAAKDFIIVSGSLPSMLRPGESFDIDIRFKPTTGDVREAYIELPALVGSGSPGIVNLEGVGTDFEQTIKLQVPSKILYKNTPIALDIEATSGLPVTLSSSDKTVAEFVDGNLVTKKFGTITITATQGGNAYFHAADPATKEVDIVVGGQSIAFNSANTYRIDDDPFELSATSTSGNPVTFASGDATVLSISGTTATILKAGVVSVTASVAGNDYFDAASQAFSITIKKAPQTISFESLAPTTFGSAVELTATGGASGQPVVFTSSNESVATIAGNTVTIVKSGNVNITASQAGNDNYDAATSVTRLLTISKGVQTITFEAPEGKTFGAEAFDLAATASSGLPVTLTSSKPGVAMIEGSTVTILGAGTVTLKASQPGNDSYSSAASVEHVLTINKAAQTITFDVPDVESGNGAVELVAEATSGLAVTFVSSNPDIAKVTGTSLEVLAAGEVEITARQTGNANYLAAEDVSHTLVVTPTVTGVGDDLADKVQVYPNPAQSYIEVELPDNITKASYRLTQISGQVVKYGDLQMNQAKTKIIVEDIGPGVYLLNISGERYTEVFRVIKN